MKTQRIITSVLTFENRKELGQYFMPYINSAYNNFRVDDDGKKAVRELVKIDLPHYVNIQYVTNGYGQLVKVVFNGKEITGKDALLNALRVVKFPYNLTITKKS